MMDETEIDVDDRIVEYDASQFGADELFDLREDALLVGAFELAARIDIERRNVLSHDGYRPTFTMSELMDLGMLLMHAKKIRYERGQQSEVERIQEMAEMFLDSLDFDPDDVSIRVEEVDELPTVEEVTDGE